MSTPAEWGDPEPFGEAEDSEPMFWECPNPECSTQKTSPEKAAAHCAGEDGDSGDTDENEPTTDASSPSEPRATTAETPPRDAPDPARVRGAVGVVLRFYHDQLDREIADHVGRCDHDSCGEDTEECDRPTTAREYFRNVRGWTDETIESGLYGWAPPADDQGELLETLVWDHGYTREEIRATGLFDEGLSPKWQGRYSLPYFDEDGQPVYGISRCTDPADRGGGGAAGYDGHPADSGYKYDKHIKNPDYAHPPDEPIFGLGSVEDGEPLLVAGGIADAITLQQAGYPCVSPVTTVRFKGPDLRKIVHLAWERDIPRVYIVNDAEPPTSERKDLDRDAETLRDAINVRANGEGRKAAIANARDFLRANIPTFFVDLPRPASFKVDPDDAVLGGWGDFDAMLASAKPAEQNDEYQKRVAEDDPRRVRRDGQLLTSATRPLNAVAKGRSDAVAGTRRTGTGRGRRSPTGGFEGGSDLWDLSFADVAGMSNADRGDNPTGHHGNSHGYYTTFNGGELGYDHKDKATHNQLTYLLVEADERDSANPEGELSDREKYVAWRRAKEEGHIPDDDPIPLPALFHVLVDEDECDADDWVWRTVEDGKKVGTSDDDPEAFDEDVRFGLPPGVFNTGLDLVEDRGVEHGREHIDDGVSDVEPVPTIPFAMLSRPRDEIVRYARKRGLEWPSTDEARDRLGEALRDTFRNEGYAVLDAPTGLGKTHEVSTTFWRQIDEAVTDGRPVVLFASTTDARDEARRMARDAGLDVKALLGYKELCPVARGDFDPDQCDDELHGTVVSIDEATRGEEFVIKGVGDRGPTTVPESAEQVRATVERETEHADEPVTITQPIDDDLAVGDEFVIQEEQQPIYIDGQLGSEWFRECVEDRSIAVSSAHVKAKELAAQGYVAHDKEASANGRGNADLACCPGEHKCRTETQWPSDGWTDDDVPRYDLVVATDPFAYVPGLRANTNVIHDEQPDYSVEFGDSEEAHQQRIQRAVTAFLEAADAPAQADTFAGLIQTGKHGFPRNDLGKPREQRQIELRDALHTDLPRDWFFEDEDAHTLAPALAKAIYYAAGDDPDENGRRTATVPHEPPRLDAGASDDDAWNRTWVTVVLDDEDGVATVRDAPDFSTARSVVGLDAWPNPYLWQRNVHPDVTRERVLDPEERSLWRRLEQGKLVVGVGDATRPAGGDGEFFTESHADAIVSQLREEFGEDFQAAGCASEVEGRMRELLDEHGVDLPDDPDRDFTEEAYQHGDDGGTMHYGEENSRNDLAEHVVGLVYGCIDPGDDYVLDLAAECDLDVRPERHECPTCEGEGCGAGDPDCLDGTRRSHGREFVGEDREDGAALLASVRENHVAQMTGRFGRAESVEQSVVFVATDATPPGLVDVEVPGVLWLARPNQKQRQLIEYLRANPSSTAREASDAVDCSKEHARQVFAALVEQGKATVTEGGGDHGADVYRWLSGASASATPFATVDLAPKDLNTDTANSHVWSSYTWQLAIPSETPTLTTPDTPSSPGQSSRRGAQTSLGGFDGADRPPDIPD